MKDGMRIKSFFAASVDQAIAQARAELGVEAMLLHTRKLDQDASYPGGYEVAFGVAGDPATAIEPVDLSPSKRSPQQDVAGELSRLHAQMDEIRNLIVRSAKLHSVVSQAVPELTEVYARLISSGVDPELSKDIVDRLEAVMSIDTFCQRGGPSHQAGANRWMPLQADSSRLETFVSAELERRVGVDPRLGKRGENGSVV